MGYQTNREKIIDTITSNFVWRIKDIKCMVENDLWCDLKTRIVNFENSNFKW